MKKTLTKIISVILAVMIMAAVFTGCGTNNDKSNGADNTADANTNTDANNHSSDDSTEKELNIGVIQYISHPSLDNCYNGVEAALLEKYGDSVKIDRQIGSDASADADCEAYAKAMVAAKVDMIIAIATPAALTAYAATEGTDIPVIFCAVSDPVAPGLVQSLDNPGGACTGTSDVLDLDAQIDLIQAMQPDVKSIGILYTTSEANSITQLEIFKGIANERGIDVVPSGVQNASDIPAAAAALANQVDCINNFTDNNVVNNLTVVLDAANSAGIPVYGSEVEQVKNGCLAAVSIDYVALGKVTGEMAIEVLNGADISTMAVRTISDATPVVNTEVLESLSMTMPEAYSGAETVTTNK